jgi:hypothetical protein
MFAALILVLAADPLRVSDPTIDAGEVRIGPSLVRKFTFTNDAAEPLTITYVRSSCGCLAPTLAQRVYETGERGELTVEVNTLSQPAGPHRWRFSLSYRCGQTTGEQSLELTAVLKQEIEVAPAAIAFRGTDPPPSVVTITDGRAKPLHVVGVSASPRLRAELIRAGVRVSIAADCPDGQATGTVTIATDDPDYREIKLPVTIDRTARRRVTALPNRATLVAGGSAMVQLHAENETVRVESVESSVPALTCRWAPGPGERSTVRIALDRTKWDGRPFNAEVRVRLQVPPGGTVIIPVSVRKDD